MYASQCLVFLALGLTLTQAQDTILGVYIFSRHGDRTAKVLAPTSLTDLGYAEIYQSGQYFRERYVAANASAQIAGISSNAVALAQITVSAAQDNVLMNSAQGFLQGLYPPVGQNLSTQTLRNGSSVSAPMDGYQLIPIETVESGTDSEDSSWLQGSTNCLNAEISSNEYVYSQNYTATLANTTAFYQSLAPVVNSTFGPNDISFKNAYTIWDYINVAEIHNSTIPSSGILTPDVLSQAANLAFQHEWGLAYNSSSSIRAVSGATLAAQIVQALNQTIATAGKSKLNIQFGEYGTFSSFFGLAQLTADDDFFYNVVDYASTMVFELFTNSSASPFPSPDNLYVRFLFNNGTASNSSTPTTYPLFKQSQVELPWQSFVNSMDAFAIGNQSAWCTACGNTTGVCASAASSSSPASSSPSSTGHGGMSNAVAGVIGAMVTLAVVLGIEVLIMLLAGLRLVSKKRLSAGPVTTSGAATGPKA